MIPSQLEIILRRIAFVVVWISGSLLGITGLLSGIGYITIRAHQDLLGISEMVPQIIESCSIEGARFVYNSIHYLIVPASLIYLSYKCRILTIKRFLPSERTDVNTKESLKKSRVLIKTSLILIILTGVIFFNDRQSNLLFRLAENLDLGFTRTTDHGIIILRVCYGLILTCVLICTIWVMYLPKLLGFQNHTKSEAKQNIENDQLEVIKNGLEPNPVAPISYYFLCFLVLICLIMLPRIYGKMVKSNYLFKIQFNIQDELVTKEKNPSLKQNKSKILRSEDSLGFRVIKEGYLLYKDPKEIIVYFKNKSSPVEVYSRDKISNIEIIKSVNIFRTNHSK